MVEGLKGYEKEHGTFPSTLDQLYPEYVPYKAFIDQIPWQYSRADAHEFLLKKRFFLKGKRMVASVDKTMQPKLRTGSIIASVGDGSETEASGQPGTGGGSEARGPGKVQPPPIAAKEERFQAPLTQPMPTQPPGVTEDESRHLEKPVPEPFSILAEKECTDFSPDLGQEHLVWKDREGVIGFGNVEYPRVERMAILTDGKWVSVERARLEMQESKEAAYSASQTSRTFFGLEVR
jgi:hypothetical protein